MELEFHYWKWFFLISFSDYSLIEKLICEFVSCNFAELTSSNSCMYVLWVVKGLYIQDHVFYKPFLFHLHLDAPSSFLA